MNIEIFNDQKIGIINEKVKWIINFIDKNKLRNKLLNIKTLNCKYSIETLITGLCIKEHFNFSGRKYDEYKKLSKIILPSDSRLRQFKDKLKEYDIYQKIYEEYINSHPELNTEVLLIDSSFIPNQNCATKKSFINRNSYYNNKFGSKITTVNSDEGIVLYFKIDSSNKHDSILGKSIIKSIPDEKINGHKLLADCGYDSSAFKEELINKKCKFIIPKNKRNTIDVKLKEEINIAVNNINIKFKNNKLRKWNKIKELKKNNKKCDINLTNEINKLKKQIKELTCKNKIEVGKIRIILKQNFKSEENKAIKNNTKKKKFNIGINDKNKLIYKKRANVEHPYNFLKQHRIHSVRWKTKSMFINEVYSSLIDMIIFREINKTKIKQ